MEMIVAIISDQDLMAPTVLVGHRDVAVPAVRAEPCVEPLPRPAHGRIHTDATHRESATELTRDPQAVCSHGLDGWPEAVK